MDIKKVQEADLTVPAVPEAAPEVPADAVVDAPTQTVAEAPAPTAESLLQPPAEGMVPTGWAYPDQIATAVAMSTGDTNVATAAPGGVAVEAPQGAAPTTAAPAAPAPAATPEAPISDVALPESRKSHDKILKEEAEEIDKLIDDLLAEKRLKEDDEAAAEEETSTEEQKEDHIEEESDEEIDKAVDDLLEKEIAKMRKVKEAMDDKEVDEIVKKFLGEEGEEAPVEDKPAEDEAPKEAIPVEEKKHECEERKEGQKPLTEGILDGLKNLVAKGAEKLDGVVVDGLKKMLGSQYANLSDEEFKTLLTSEFGQTTESVEKTPVVVKEGVEEEKPCEGADCEKDYKTLVEDLAKRNALLKGVKLYTSQLKGVKESLEVRKMKKLSERLRAENDRLEEEIKNLKKATDCLSEEVAPEQDPEVEPIKDENKMVDAPEAKEVDLPEEKEEVPVEDKVETPVEDKAEAPVEDKTEDEVENKEVAPEGEVDETEKTPAEEEKPEEVDVDALIDSLLDVHEDTAEILAKVGEDPVEVSKKAVDEVKEEAPVEKEKADVEPAEEPVEDEPAEEADVEEDGDAEETNVPGVGGPAEEEADDQMVESKRLRYPAGSSDFKTRYAERQASIRALKTSKLDERALTDGECADVPARNKEVGYEDQDEVVEYIPYGTDHSGKMFESALNGTMKPTNSVSRSEKFLEKYNEHASLNLREMLANGFLG